MKTGMWIAAILFGPEEVDNVADLVGSKNLENPALLDRAQEVVQQLLWEAETEAELDRLKGLTPEQIADEAKDSGLPDGWGRLLLARAIEQVDAQASQPDPSPEPSLEDQIEDLLDEAWVLFIRAMPPAAIRALARGRSLTDEQVEAIARRAHGRIEEADRRDAAQARQS